MTEQPVHDPDRAELALQLASARGALARATARLEAERARSRGLESALEVQRAQLEAIRRSRSWKVTTPLRLLRRRHLTDIPS